jgi:threonine synthase
MKIRYRINSLTHLSCSCCGKRYSSLLEQSFATCCNKPLVAKYALDDELSINFSNELLVDRPSNMWRYKEVLPVFEERNIVSLGEGMTPVIELKKLAHEYELPNLMMKDESKNPTGSFKARGLSAAISKAKEFGVTHCIVPTAGNAGGAMAAYCAAAGIRATVVMPRHTPEMFKEECELYGAELILEDGLISDCAKKVAALKAEKNYYDVSTLKEPYRLEGKKTLGYEIAEQFNWNLPDVILYPTGGGTGLIGIWKAFHEMQQLGWIGGKLPRMIAVQAENCQPIVQTWKELQPNAKNYIGKPSLANGLAVPNPFAEDMILEVLRASFGFPVAVSERSMILAVKEVARKEGILMAPEGGALWAALLQLIETGMIRRNEKILLLNTGSGYKYMENL